MTVFQAGEGFPGKVRGSWRCLLVLWMVGGAWLVRAGSEGDRFPGISYTNYHTKEPWSIHVVRIDRSVRGFGIRSVHANGTALGLSTLSAQAGSVKEPLRLPVAAVNGDFYKRESSFIGDPRGLQIVDGDILSSPTGGATFWMDAVGDPHVDDVSSRFVVSLPQGQSVAFGVNEECVGGRPVLYTPKFPSPVAGRGRELLLESDGATPLSPFRIGRKYLVRVAENRIPNGSMVPADKWILLLSPQAPSAFARVEPGAKLEVSTLSSPSLRGVHCALSGGPILVRDGRHKKLEGSDSDTFQVSSMFERHPRTAIGWNEQSFFLVEVDGRQKRLSVGMTLEELSTYMLGLGCQNAVNFDGGGSSTLWYLGKVRNSPCDGRERSIANSLIAVAEPQVQIETSKNP